MSGLSRRLSCCGRDKRREGDILIRCFLLHAPWPLLQRLGDVGRADALAACQVGDRARELEQAMIRAPSAAIAASPRDVRCVVPRRGGTTGASRPRAGRHWSAAGCRAAAAPAPRRQPCSPVQPRAPRRRPQPSRPTRPAGRPPGRSAARGLGRPATGERSTPTRAAFQPCAGYVAHPLRKRRVDVSSSQDRLSTGRRFAVPLVALRNGRGCAAARM